MTGPVLDLTLPQLRALRILHQGLAEPSSAPLPRLLAATGFVRTLGGVDAYLALRARAATLTRSAVDAQVERGELLVLPAMRGCIYLVPRADAALCLRVAERRTRSRDERDRAKAGIEPGETEALAATVLAALRKSGPMTTDALRRTLPTGAVRSLGERGTKAGVSSPLPGALRLLEFDGKVQRVPEGGRLDTNTYLWRATARDPFAAVDLPTDEARLHALLLDRFLAHAGAATLAQFGAWSGLAQREAKAACPHSSALAVRIEGAPALAHPTVAERLRSLDAAQEAVALLPFEDNLLHLGGGPAEFVAATHHGRVVPVWGGKGTSALGAAKHLAFRSVLADGSVQGFWEYDPATRSAVVQWLLPAPKAAQRRVAELAAATAAFLRDEVGHGRSFSLDTDAELSRRVALLRSIAPTAAAQRGARAPKRAAKSPPRKR